MPTISPVAPHWLAFLLKTSRPGLWSTALWFYLLPICSKNVVHSNHFWIGAIYVTFPLGLLLYGWNDTADFKTDRLNPRKDSYLFGARGAKGDHALLPGVTLLVHLPFVFAFWECMGERALLWLGALLLANIVYNTPPFRFKNRPLLDMLSQACYLLIFVLSSWLNQVPQLPWTTFTLGALFAMHSHLLAHIIDVVPDSQAGRYTIVTAIGVVRSKALVVVLLFTETLLAAFAFHNFWIAGILGLAAGWFILDIQQIFRDRSYPQSLVRFWGLSLNVVMLSSLWWVWSSAPLTRLP